MIKSFSAYSRDPQVKFKDQEADETVLLLLRRHPVTNAWWVVLTIVFTLLPLIFLLGNPLPSFLDVSFLPTRYFVFALFVWYLFTFGFVLYRFLDWFFNASLVTNKRVVDMDYFNLLYFKVSETDYPKVQDVTYDVTGFLGTFFNFGDVEIQTAGTEENFIMDRVPNPAGVHDLITDNMEKP